MAPANCGAYCPKNQRLAYANDTHSPNAASPAFAICSSCSGVSRLAQFADNLPIDGDGEAAFHLDEVARRDSRNPALIDGIL